MFYKKSAKKEDIPIKEEILFNFSYIFDSIKDRTNLLPRLSLHCEYDRPELWNHDITFYMISVNIQETKNFIEKYGFEKIEELPKGLIHILGFDNMTIKPF